MGNGDSIQGQHHSALRIKGNIVLKGRVVIELGGSKGVSKGIGLSDHLGVKWEVGVVNIKVLMTVDVF